MKKMTEESSTLDGVLAREWKESFEEIYEGAVDEENPPVKLFEKAYDGAVIATSYAEILLNQASVATAPTTR